MVITRGNSEEETATRNNKTKEGANGQLDGPKNLPDSLQIFSVKRLQSQFFFFVSFIQRMKQ